MTKLLVATLAASLFATTAAANSPTAIHRQVLGSGVIVDHTILGTGRAPAATDTVVVHYRGTLPNGQEFDSSYKRGEPATFPLDGVIPCWTEAVQLLREGGRATLTCPAETAYGSSGAAGVIPPNTDLTFEVELELVRGH